MDGNLEQLQRIAPLSPGFTKSGSEYLLLRKFITTPARVSSLKPRRNCRMKLRGYSITHSVTKVKDYCGLYYLVVTARKGGEWYRISCPYGTKKEARSKKSIVDAVNEISGNLGVYAQN